MPLNFLIVGSETPEQRDARQSCTSAASDESYAQTLRSLVPDSVCRCVSCVEAGEPLSIEELRGFDAVFFPGSPIKMYADSPETRRAATFMRNVFASGVPAFGSCAGLQIAAVAAGGSAQPRGSSLEAGFTRGIVATEAGRSHPLLRGRPVAWDAPTMHSDEVGDLPESATVLAMTKTTPVQAVEIRHGEGVFWGVQYHPELTLAEIAVSLRRSRDELIEVGLASDADGLEAYAGRIGALAREPGRRDLAWEIGIDDEITDPAKRTLELRNFIAHFTGFA